jgi:predicted acyl esterase
MKVFISLLCFFFLSTVFANVCIQVDLKETDEYKFKNKIQITSLDGMKISANLITPKRNTPREGWPTIIFANSWLLDEHEYLVQASKLAKEGFQILSYSMRGWGCSEGELDILGPKDISDIKSIVNWVRDNTEVDMNNIGMSGISYGGGMSLMALAHDDRIKTAVAMSAWGSLTEALYKDETPRKFWTDFLVYTALFFASPSEEMGEMVSNLFNHRNIEETLKWTHVRNPINYISNINKRNAPVYIANNFGDNLFTPNNVWKFYDQLSGPKRLDLNQGAHATGEVFGLVGVDSYTWNKALDWFNYYLKGIVDNEEIKSKKIVTMLTDLSHHREVYSEIDLKNFKKEKLFLLPRKTLLSGTLSRQKYLDEEVENTISSRLNSGATTGIPFLSAIIDGNLRVPVVKFLPSLLWNHGITFNGDSALSKMEIRGIPSISINIKPRAEKIQLVAYLYHKNIFGYGKLITHGSVTLHNAKVGVERQLTFDLNATAYDIPKGDKVSLVIDTKDVLYLKPTDSFFKVGFQFKKSSQSFLNLPVK